MEMGGAASLSPRRLADIARWAGLGRLDVQFFFERLHQALVNAQCLRAATVPIEQLHGFLRGPLITRVGLQELLEWPNGSIRITALLELARQADLELGPGLLQPFAALGGPVFIHVVG